MPRVEDGELEGLVRWLERLDEGWVAVIRGESWESKGNGGGGSGGGSDSDEVEERDGRKERRNVLTQTEKTRLKSMLITGTARIEEWLAGSKPEEQVEDTVDRAEDYSDMLERRGLMDGLERLFEGTLKELDVEEMGLEVDRLLDIDEFYDESALRENAVVEMAEGGEAESDEDMEET